MIKPRSKSEDSRIARFAFAASSERWKQNGGSFSVGIGWRRVSTTTLTRFVGQTGGPRSEKNAEFNSWFRECEFCWLGGAWLTAEQVCGRSVQSAGGKGAVGSHVAWRGVVVDSLITIGNVTLSETDLLIMFGSIAGTDSGGLLLGCGGGSSWHGMDSAFGWPKFGLMLYLGWCDRKSDVACCPPNKNNIAWEQ